MEPRPAPPISGFHHITLPVLDLEAAERFYVDLLGGRLLRRFDREAFLRLRGDRAHEVDNDNSPLHLEIAVGDHGPELHLFLQRNQVKPRPRPHPHFAFKVEPGQLDPFALRLQNAGVPIDGPRRLGPPGQASVYFADPSGNMLELVTLGYEGPVLFGPPDTDALGW